MIQFAWPWVFILLPLPWVLRRYIPPADLSASAALKIPFFESIASISHQAQHQHLVKRWQKYCAITAWVLLVIATAGPQKIGDPIHLPQQGRDIMLAVDVSGSMQVPDMRLESKNVDRLSAVKVVAGNFIKRRQSDRLGLILFGSKAYLQTPLTFDRKTVQTMLDDSSIGLAGPRTAIGDAIGLAIKRLQTQAEEGRVLILLTDGVSNAGVLSPEEATQFAAEKGIKIYTIGIGADKLEVPGMLGPQVINPSAELDEKALMHIASQTGGTYFRAKDSQSLNKIYHLIDKLEPISRDKSLFRPHTELYPVLLILALLLCLILIVNKFDLSMRRLHKRGSQYAK